LEHEASEFCSSNASLPYVNQSRGDDFEKFMEKRQAQLLRLIEEATGQKVYQGETVDEEEETDAELAEAELTMTAGP